MQLLVLGRAAPTSNAKAAVAKLVSSFAVYVSPQYICGGTRVRSIAKAY